MSLADNCGVSHQISNTIKMVFTETDTRYDTTAQDKIITSVWSTELAHGSTWQEYILLGPSTEWSAYIWCIGDGKTVVEEFNGRVETRVLLARSAEADQDNACLYYKEVII